MASSSSKNAFSRRPVRRPARPPAELRAMVADVARHASADGPGQVTREQFNLAREHAGHAECPRAQRLCEIRGCGWQQVLVWALAHTEPSSAPSAASVSSRAPIEPFTAEHAAPALKRIHSRLVQRTHSERQLEQAERERSGVPETEPWTTADPEWLIMTEAAYDAEVQALREAADRRRGHRLPLRLPSAARIKSLTGTSFALACREAGLPHEQPQAPGGKNKGLAVVDAIVAYVDAYDAQPTQKDLTAFAAGQRFALASRTAPWPELIDAAAGALADRGEQMPPVPPVGQRPDVTAPTGVRYGPEPRRRLSLDERLDLVDEFTAWLAAGHAPHGPKPTQRNFKAFFAARDGGPGEKAVVRKDGLLKMLRLAAERRSRHAAGRRAHPLEDLIGRAGPAKKTILRYAADQADDGFLVSDVPIGLTPASVREHLGHLARHGALDVQREPVAGSGAERLRYRLRPGLPARVVEMIDALPQIKPAEQRGVVLTPQAEWLLGQCRKLGQPFTAPDVRAATGVSRKVVFNGLDRLEQLGLIVRGDRAATQGQPYQYTTADD